MRYSGFCWFVSLFLTLILSSPAFSQERPIAPAIAVQNAMVEFEEYLRLAPKGEFSEQTRAVVQKLKQAVVNKKN